MNRDELLSVCFGDAPARGGKKIIEVTDGSDVLAHLDLDYRRVVVRTPTAANGNAIADATATLMVAAIGRVCVDPDQRGNGYGRLLLETAHGEATTHETVSFAAVFGCLDFFGRFGYAATDGGPAGFLVSPLREGWEWPTGSVDTRGEW